MTGSGTNNWAIVVGIAVGVLLLVISLIWLRSYFFLVRNEQIDRVVLSVPNPALGELRVREDQQLGTYGWVDQGQGIVRIPIDRAMELMVESSRGAGEEEP